MKTLAELRMALIWLLDMRLPSAQQTCLQALYKHLDDGGEGFYAAVKAVRKATLEQDRDTIQRQIDQLAKAGS